MSKLEDEIIVALINMEKECRNSNGMLRYRYIQNWFTAILIKCEPETNITEFYKRLGQ